jgi:hypothetical protein
LLLAYRWYDARVKPHDDTPENVIHAHEAAQWIEGFIRSGQVASREYALEQIGEHKVERATVFTVEAWDINCPQHIHKRLAQRQITPLIEALQARIADLEARLAQALEQGKATS